MSKRKSQAGFTLVEMVVSIACAAIVTAAAISLMYLGSKIFVKANDSVENQQNASVVLDLVEDLASSGEIEDIWDNGDDNWYVISSSDSETDDTDGTDASASTAEYDSDTTATAEQLDETATENAPTGTKYVLMYDASAGTISTGNGGNVVLDNVTASEISLDDNNGLLKLSITLDGKDTYSTSVYCRTTVGYSSNDDYTLTGETETDSAALNSVLSLYGVISNSTTTDGTSGDDPDDDGTTEDGTTEDGSTDDSGTEDSSSSTTDLSALLTLIADTADTTETYDAETIGRAYFLYTLLMEYGSDGTIQTGDDAGMTYSLWYCGGESYWDGWDADTPWCAVFISWALAQLNDIEGLTVDIPKYSSVESWVNYLYLNSGSGTSWTYTLNSDSDIDPDDLEPGDLIVFDWQTDGDPDHIGVVLYVSGGTIYTIEGNSSDSVCIRAYSVDDSRIYGYGSLNWAGTSSVTESETDTTGTEE